MRHHLSLLPFLLASAAGCSGANSLPPTSEIEGMTAGVYDLVTWEMAEFVVPREHWSAVTDALLPATPDRNPFKWQVVGELRITTRGGSRRTVWLYSTGGGPGAFSVGKDPSHRVYYRGGDTVRLVAALEAARREASAP